MTNGISKETAREAMSPDPSQLLEFFLIFYGWPTDVENFIALTPIANVPPFNSSKQSSIIWQGIRYHSIGLQSQGFNLRGDNELVRPRLSISNAGLEISKYLKTHNNLIGAKVVRKRTFAKFLDDANFIGGQNPYYDLKTNSSTADINSYFPDQVYYVNRRVTENKDIVELELSSILEVENVFVPNRNVYSRYCTWVYRGHGCDYGVMNSPDGGKPKTTSNSQPFIDTAGNEISQSDLNNRGKWSSSKTYNRGDYVYVETDNYLLRADIEVRTNVKRKLKTYYVSLTSNIIGTQHFPPISKHWARDECAKKISSCKLRFAGQLPFGGFPGTHEYPPRGPSR